MPRIFTINKKSILYFLTFFGWFLFFLGYRLLSTQHTTNWQNTWAVYFPALVFITFMCLWCLSRKIRDFFRTRLERHTEYIDQLPDAHIVLWIALASGLGLFIELMIIRLHSSYFQLFAYFKNISLLSCFLGFGIGFARGPKKPVATPLIFPFLAVQIIFMYLLRISDINMHHWLQNPIEEQLALGMDQAGGIYSLIFVYGFLVLIFSLNTLCFIPIGHLISRLMTRHEKLRAYSWNLIGSLGGILLFNLISFAWSPPSVWIVITALGLILFYYRDILNLSLSLFFLVILLVLLAFPFKINHFNVYSPYQILTLNVLPDKSPVLSTSNTFYQHILNLSDEHVSKNKDLLLMQKYYDAPYQFKPHPEQVLVVGSGTGNDVAAALRNNAQHVDAVEIDPAILAFGKSLHPEQPYQSPKVRSYTNDARVFIRHAKKKYDLIVYGLLDSHTLLAGRAGGIRLDSYVYTVEAFKEARAQLKDGGQLSVAFGALSPEFAKKIFLMLQQAFDGQYPLVYKTPVTTIFLAGIPRNKTSFVNTPEIENLTGILLDPQLQADMSTDDWPFLYMPKRKYPISYGLMILNLIVISGIFIYCLVPGTGSGFSYPCFFLGAGFMLLETKAITELALVYGSTWIVISVVIAAILTMAFLANVLAMRIRILPRFVCYGLLCGSVILGLGLVTVQWGAMSSWGSKLVMTTVLTLPLFFSGFAFSSELKKGSSVATALYSNLLGAMLGGFLEYNSMYFGFRSLYFFCIFMYILAFLGSKR